VVDGDRLRPVDGVSLGHCWSFLERYSEFGAQKGYGVRKKNSVANISKNKRTKKTDGTNRVHLTHLVTHLVWPHQ